MDVQFLVTTVVVALIPGTGVVYTLAAGLSRGTRASLIAAVGCTLGVLPAVLAAITGLSALLYTSAVAFQVVRYLGVAYLLYLAWSTWRESGSLDLTRDTAPRSAGGVIGRAVLINILNPKLAIFFVAFLPQFVDTRAPGATLRIAELSGVFMVVTFVVFVGYGVFAAQVRNHVVSRPQVLRWIRRTFAAVFVALGVRLALTDR